MKIYYMIVGVLGVAAAIWSAFYGDPVFLTVPCAYAGGTLFASALVRSRS